MNESNLKKYLEQIQPTCKEAKALAENRQSKLAKPPGSLGELEEISIRFAAITGKVRNEIAKTRIIVMCADNGVVSEGVSSAPQSVTASQAVNMTRRKTGMSSIAKHFGDDVEVVDVGIATPYACDDIINLKIAEGTKNLRIEPAITRQQVLNAIEIGINRAEKAKQDGISIIGVGEMGIGNTTTSSAVLSVLTGLSVDEVTGRGGGLTDDAYTKKKMIIEQAIATHQPDANDVIDVLAKVGGLDIAAMCGVFLGCAIYKIPVVIDGFISVVAALCANMLSPLASEYMFPSHISYEPGYKHAIEKLGLRPYFSLDMRLGEGSGCPLAFRIIEAALAAMNNMALFGEESEINDDYLEKIREGNCF